MGGYKNGKVEIFYGDNPPSNLNILWQKRIVTNDVESSELMQYNNNLAMWESLRNKTIQDEIDAINSLNGTNYVMVYGVGTPTKNAEELQAAYDEAKKMPRYLGILSSSTPIQMYKGQTFGIFTGSYLYYKILVDGTYNPFSLPINLKITESEAKTTRTTLIVAPGEYNFSPYFEVNASSVNVISLTGQRDVIVNDIYVNASHCRIHGIESKNVFFVEPPYTDLIISLCKGLVEGSFGGSDSPSNIQTSATFIDCIGGNYAFGGNGEASGKFIRCIGGNYSFGGAGGLLTGILENCKLTSGEYTTPTASGKIYNCIDGNGNLINYPLISSSGVKIKNIVFDSTYIYKLTPEDNGFTLIADAENMTSSAVVLYDYTNMSNDSLEGLFTVNIVTVGYMEVKYTDGVTLTSLNLGSNKTLLFIRKPVPPTEIPIVRELS